MNYSFVVDKDLFYLIEQSLTLILRIAINNVARLEKCQEESSDWIERIGLDHSILLEKKKANDISKLIESLKGQEKIQVVTEKVRALFEERKKIEEADES